MLSKQFWFDVGERAVKTAAQTAVALIGTGVVGFIEVDWMQVASVAGVAAVVSVLTSLASDRVGDPGTASLVGRHAE